MKHSCDRHLWYILADSAAFCAAWLLAFALRKVLIPIFGYDLNEVDNYLAFLVPTLPLWLVLGGALSHLAPPLGNPFASRPLAATRLGMLAFCVALLLAFLWRELEVGRSVVLLFGAVLPGTLLLGWHLADGFVGNAAPASALLLGSGQEAQALLRRIQVACGDAVKLLGVIASEPDDTTGLGLPVLGNKEQLHDILDRNAVRLLFVAGDQLSRAEFFTLLDRCASSCVHILALTREYPFLSKGFSLDMVDQLPVIPFSPQRRDKFYLWVKETFDRLIAFCLLLAFLPLFVFLAAAIKMSSPGPIVLRQQRVGRDGRSFTMFKLRTMDARTELYAHSPTSSEDPRITPLGRYLRRFSIDELPQLLNVLRGEMSLVGPRPEMPFLAEQYEPWQRKRLMAKPGMTGLWQILGRKELPLFDNLHYDLFYLQNRSLALDIGILVRTIPVVLFRRGAY